MKNIFFFDLDNTIYFTEPNKEVLMSGLYARLDAEDLGLTRERYEQAKQDMLRIPFLKVAEHYHFPDDIVSRTISYLSEREVTEPLILGEDYRYIQALKGRKFIVTAGFPKQQLSKIKMLGIAEDFEEVQVVDVSRTDKKAVFAQLIEENGFNRAEILVVGDDANSEIKAGLELGLDTFLIDPENRYPQAKSTYTGTDFSNLLAAAGQVI